MRRWFVFRCGPRRRTCGWLAVVFLITTLTLAACSKGQIASGDLGRSSPTAEQPDVGAATGTPLDGLTPPPRIDHLPLPITPIPPEQWNNTACHPTTWCEELEPGLWRCGEESTSGGAWAYFTTCTYDGCRWQCQKVQSPERICTPKDFCRWLGSGQGWVCRDGEYYDACRREMDCYWFCSVFPPKDPNTDPTRTCQPSNGCREVAPQVWYCDEGLNSPYAGNYYQQCEYTGCTWFCAFITYPPTHNNEVCRPWNACNEIRPGYWECVDGWYTSCSFDGCQWICSGQYCHGEDFCEKQPDGTWLCQDGPATDCVYDGVCNWYCVRLPPSSPCEGANYCTQQDNGLWRCGLEGEFISCTFDGCDWDCNNFIFPPDGGEGSDPNAGCQPEDLCGYDGDLDRWVCEGDAMDYDSCEYDGCTWQCDAGLVLPDDPLCDSPATCVYDEGLGVWVCGGVEQYEACDYDGCYWFCDAPIGEPVCQPEDFCLQVDANAWECEDGVYQTCEYDGCVWTCFGDPDICQPADYCVQQPDGYWVCEDGEYASCTYAEGCVWECE